MIQGVRRLLWLFLLQLVCAIVLVSGSSHAQSKWTDPRLIQWAKDYLDGKRDAVLQSIERDLIGSSPHPEARSIWFELAVPTPEDLAGALARAPERVREALGDYPRLRAEYEKGACSEISAAVPVKAARQAPVDTLQLAWRCALNRDRRADAYELGMALFSRSDDYEGAEFAVLSVTSLRSQTVRFNDFLRAIEPKGPLGRHPYSQALRESLDKSSRSQSPLDALAAVERYLKARPRDVGAIYHRASLLRDLERYPEAIEARRVAIAISPFDVDGIGIATDLLNAGRPEDARKEIERAVARRKLPEERANARVTAAWAEALGDAGEIAKARDVLEAAVVRHPRDARLLKDLARRELSDGHPGHPELVHAVELARKLVEVQPWFDNYELLLEALRAAGRPEETLAAFERARKLFPDTTPKLFSEAGSALTTLKRQPEAERTFELATRLHPQSQWMLNDLAEQRAARGDHAGALKVLRSAHDVSGPTRWSVKRALEWTQKLREQKSETGKGDGLSEALKVLAELERSYPFDEEPFLVHVRRLAEAGKKDEAIALCRRGRDVAPGAEWPGDKLIELLHQQKRWDEALDAAREAVARAASGTPTAIARSNLLVAATVERRSLEEPLPAGLAEEALSAIARYRATGGSPAVAADYARRLYFALGRNSDATRALIELLRLRPGSVYSVYELFSRGDPDLGARVKWAAVQRIVERKPYDADAMQDMTKLHAMWSGGPIVALNLATQLEATTGRTTTLAATAAGRLGDGERVYRELHLKSTRVDPSDLYVSWYDRDRAMASEEVDIGLPFVAASQQSCPTDFAQKFVTPGLSTWAAICNRRNGSVLIREENPISGKVQMLRHGAAYVRYGYDDIGDRLLKIESSNGEIVSLTYDGGGRIETLASRRGKKLSFKYNEKGKPLQIAIEGLGSIDVTYEEDGEKTRETKSAKGPEVARAVMRAMNELVDLTRIASEEVPDIPYLDPKLDRLRDAVYASDSQTSRSRARFMLARHLVTNVQNGPRHADEADPILARLIQENLATERPRAGAALGLDALSTWIDLKRITRPAGLSGEELSFLQEVKRSLEKRATDKNAVRERGLLERLARDPSLHLMRTARWLGRSDLSGKGVWRRHATSSVLPRSLRDAALQTALWRAKGELVVGTSRGLALFVRGSWRWYGFDDARSRFSRDVAFSNAGASSNVLSLAEDSAGRLWVGTETGLLAVAGEIDGPLEIWRSSNDGLPAARIAALAAYDDGVVAGTASGARFVRPGAPAAPIAGLENEPLLELSNAAGYDPSAPLLGVGPSGVFALSKGKVSQVARGAVASASYCPEERSIVLLRGSELSSLPWDGPASGLQEKPLPGQEELKGLGRLNGLGLLPIDREGTTALAILTDRGLSLFRQAHIEHLDVQDADRRLGVQALGARHGRAALLTSSGVHALELDQTRVRPGKVMSLLTLQPLDATFVLRDTGLTVIRHDDEKLEEQRVDSIYGAALAPHPAGGFVVNDGLHVFHYDPELGAPKKLFEAVPDQEPPELELWKKGPLRSLLVASDRAIWAAAGGYAYRFKDGRKETFSTVVDARRFPLSTHMVSRVVETVDGEIWVIGSDQKHLSWNGIELRGGVVQWTGKDFKRLDLSERDGWFIRGYTRVGNGLAIAGTSDGFARHRAGRFGMLESPSYERLIARNPQQFLGTRGARLGGLWLFGAAGGVVGYRNGDWFVPDRLNAMLPEQGLAERGSRHVNAVETDSRGRVYVGTDHGLLVYDSGGGDAASFLLSNELESMAFASTDREQFERENDVLLGGLSKDNPLWQRIERINALKQEITALEGRQDSAKLTPVSAEGKSTPPPGDAEREAADRVLREKSVALASLLLRLEQKEPALHRLVDAKPMELNAVKGELAEDQALVQYLPTDRRLYVQVLTKTEQKVREIDVSRDALFERARRVATRLAGDTRQARKSLRAVVLSAAAGSSQSIDDDLSWLYEQLLRPIEGDLDGRSNVIVVPLDALTYVPFGALLRSKQPREYAVERYSFGYITSLYMFRKMQKIPTGQRAVVFGDPDGTLPGARREATLVAGLSRENLLRLGDEASYDALLKFGPGAAQLHLATHALLDHENPARSALLLARGALLTVPDAQTLQLGNADLVVLSACETGIGRSGLEYATLARAFMLAGASTVVATLWQVDDAASSELMREFYRKLEAGAGRAEALTLAQRKLLKHSRAALNAPASWASYISFGRP